MKKKIAGGKRGGGLWRRVRFLSSSLLSDDYVAVLKGADVILDTFPFGNFLPSVTGLMLGTPVVTLSSEQRKGEREREREGEREGERRSCPTQS